MLKKVTVNTSTRINILECEDKVPRHKWVLGHIYQDITGKDGSIRGIKLFVGKTKKQLNANKQTAEFF